MPLGKYSKIILVVAQVDKILPILVLGPSTIRKIDYFLRLCPLLEVPFVTKLWKLFEKVHGSGIMVQAIRHDNTA